MPEVDLEAEALDPALKPIREARAKYLRKRAALEENLRLQMRRQLVTEEAAVIRAVRRAHKLGRKKSQIKRAYGTKDALTIDKILEA